MDEKSDSMEGIDDHLHSGSACFSCLPTLIFRCGDNASPEDLRILFPGNVAVMNKVSTKAAGASSENKISKVKVNLPSDAQPFPLP